MSAETLRKAAERVRWLADGVKQHGDGWFDADVDLRNAIRGTFKGNLLSAPDDARWIALMTPDLGHALADWLDKEADFARSADQLASPHASIVARLILGGAS